MKKDIEKVSGGYLEMNNKCIIIMKSSGEGEFD
jgi:hypothetical protein